MKPGTYSMVVYKNELAVWTGSVTVAAGSPTTVNTVTATDPSSTSTIWRIGDSGRHSAGVSQRSEHHEHASLGCA
ncbi:MAG: hypothetical protein QM796_13005 [Chthoniobacteraceae bacterium]